MTKVETNSRTTFRVHATGGNVDIPADSPDHAREIFKQRHPDRLITKIKAVKGGDAYIQPGAIMR